MSGIRVVRAKSFITPNDGIVLRTLDFMSFMVTAYVAALFEKRPDVVAATSPQFVSAVGGWAVVACRRIPFVFELSDLWPASIVAVGAMKYNFLLWLMERLELFLYRRAAAIVALIDAFKKNLVGRGILAGKIVVVLNGVDLPRYAPTPKDSGLAAEHGLENKFIVGYVGTHGMAHGLGIVLSAAERLRNNDRIRFMFAGPGAARETLMLDARRRRLDNVAFLPPQPKSRMPAEWSLCDAALIHLRNDPVFAEVIRSKIFEAMAMGLPLLVAVPPGEATRIVEADGARIVVEPKNSTALADAVLRLANDKVLCGTLTARSLAAAPLHSRAHQATAMMVVLEAAAAGHGHQAVRFAANRTGASPKWTT
jgi:glycosyltransferase involved in cell wall biosynthesis